VRIDGEEIAPADYLHAEVDPGNHTLVAGAPGRKIFTQQFDVEGRGGQTIDIELVEGESSIVVDPGAGRRRTAYIVGGSGVLLMAVSGLISWRAKVNYDRFAKDGAPIADVPIKSSWCPDGTCTEDQAREAANHYRFVARWVGTPIFAAGAVAFTGAIVLYVTAPDKERIDQMVFRPVVTPEHVGFAISGGF
jgi:hypothetical protein